MLTVVRRSAAALLAVGLLPGCASDPDPSPPSGVDELTIPTPTPDPDDFVEGIDNPWLSWEAGSTTTLSGSSGSVTIAVADAPVQIAGGIDAWVVTTSSVGGEQSDTYAQDERGNVWLVGRQGVFTVGVDGADAGLFMAATPRYGDGYRTAYRAGVVEERAEVTALKDDRVEITTTDPANPGADTVATYEKGVGLTYLETSEGVFER